MLARRSRSLVVIHPSIPRGAGYLNGSTHPRRQVDGQLSRSPGPDGAFCHYGQPCRALPGRSGMRRKRSPWDPFIGSLDPESDPANAGRVAMPAPSLNWQPDRHAWLDRHVAVTTDRPCVPPRRAVRAVRRCETADYADHVIVVRGSHLDVARAEVHPREGPRSRANSFPEHVSTVDRVVRPEDLIPAVVPVLTVSWPD